MIVTDEILRKISLQEEKTKHKNMLKAGNKNKLYAQLRCKYKNGIVETITLDRNFVNLNIVKYVQFLEEEIQKEIKNARA